MNNRIRINLKMKTKIQICVKLLWIRPNGSKRGQGVGTYTDLVLVRLDVGVLGLHPLEEGGPGEPALPLPAHHQPHPGTPALTLHHSINLTPLVIIRYGNRQLKNTAATKMKKIADTLLKT